MRGTQRVALLGHDLELLAGGDEHGFELGDASIDRRRRLPTHRRANGYPSSIALSIPLREENRAVRSMHACRTSRRRLGLDVDAVEKIVERALVDGDAGRVVLDLGQPERAAVQPFVEQA